MSQKPLPRRRIAGLASGAAVFAVAMIAGLTPPPETSVSEWAEQKRVVSAESGSPFPGRWSNDLAPYMVEVMDHLTLTDPSREVILKKSAQVAGTEAGINLVGYIIDHAPSPVMIVLPSLDEAQRYHKVKLQPAIDATSALRMKVKEQRSRSEDGSTTSFKRFRGGFLQITGANSSKGLQMLSARVIIFEELSEWPADADGRGDPMELAEARNKAWSEQAKRFYTSTPGITEMCRISAKYEGSDKRLYYVPCPHCGTHQVLNWENFEWRSEERPHGAYYVCQANGCIIEHHSKRAMVANGVWLKTYGDEDAPEEWLDPTEFETVCDRDSHGREPGFHIWQGYSPFVSWDDTVAEWLRAKGQPSKEKVFTQQALGMAWEEKGEAPEWEGLYLRREDYPVGRIPQGGLFLTAGADVQADRIEIEVVAWGVGKTSWSVDYIILTGNTAETKIWRDLSEIYAREFEDAAGRSWPIEAFAVDSGYRPQMVYAWARGLPRAMATKGMGGHLHAPLGVATRQEIRTDGRRSKGSALLFPVGTWQLKAEFYGQLRLAGGEPGTEMYPSGFCHYPTAYGEEYFQQATAEQLITRETRNGVQRREWKKTRERNEALDCRILAMAAAVRAGIDRMTPDKWAALAETRGVDVAKDQLELASMWAPGVASAAKANAVRQGRRRGVRGRVET